MKTRISEQSQKYIWNFVFLYLAGFVIGILFINFFHQKMLYESSTLGIYLMSGKETDFSKSEYFCSLLVNRGSWYLLYALGGLTAFGIPLVLGGLLWLGFLAGSLLTMFLMEYGIKGMLLCIACVFPQCLLYVPAAGILFLMAFQMSKKFWKSKSTAMGEYKSYGFFLSITAVLFLWGIFLESYINFYVLEYIKQVL